MSQPRQTRSIQLAIRFTPEEVEALRREATRREWSLAQVLRKRALKGLTIEAPASETELKAVGQ